jgi:hypothetical protein
VKEQISRTTPDSATRGWPWTATATGS